MGENKTDLTVVESPQQNNPKFFGIPQKELLDEFVYPLIKKELKSQLNITTEHIGGKNKSAFGRTMGTLKEFLQGTWWIYPLVVLSIGLSLLALKVLAKWAGV